MHSTMEMVSSWFISKRCYITKRIGEHGFVLGLDIFIVRLRNSRKKEENKK